MSYTQEQYLTDALTNYFPRLIEENLERLPFLDNFAITRDDVEAEYSERGDQEEGMAIEVNIDLRTPREAIIARLESVLRLAVLEWLDSKEIPRQAIPVVLTWNM